MITLEMLIAMAIMVFIISSVTAITFGNQMMVVDALTNNEAMVYAKQKLTEDDFDSAATENFGLSSGPLMYTGKNTVTDISPCLKQLNTRMDWKVEARNQYSQLDTLLASPAEARALGGDCATEPVQGAWNSPASLNSADIDPAGAKGTGLDVLNKFVYISADPSAAADDDFFIFDARNTTQSSAPVLVGSLNTGPGLAAIDVADNFAYVANDSKNGQLQIINVSDPFGLDTGDLVATLNVVPGGTDNDTVGQSIFYYNAKIYLGLKKNTHAEFYAIDVSNPASPSVIGSYEVDAGVNAVHVKGNYAYIATPNSEELTIIDINQSSPDFMQRVGGFDAPLGSGNGKSIQIVGNKLYLGRTIGSREFYILDITNPISPVALGSYDVNASINDLVVAGNYAFLATSEANLEFQVFNISVPASPTRLGKYNYSEHATGIDYEDDWIYVSNESQDALRIIVDNP